MELICRDALIEKYGDWYIEEGTEEGYIGSLETLLSDEPTVEPTWNWISVKDRLPEQDVEVLVVKQLKSGQRNIGLAYCIPEYEYINYSTGETKREPRWVCNGNNNVIYWMPLPKMPTMDGGDDDAGND